jgi:hypothetical protein
MKSFEEGPQLQRCANLSIRQARRCPKALLVNQPTGDGHGVAAALVAPCALGAAMAAFALRALPAYFAFQTAVMRSSLEAEG